MSFLAGGAECSTSGNPLAQFSKHVQDDKSLQRDRLVGRGPGGMQEGMRGSMRMGGEGDGMMDEFMKAPNPMLGSHGPGPQLNMEPMIQRFSNLNTGPQRNGSPIHNWASEFDPGMTAAGDASQRMNGFNPAEFDQYMQEQRFREQYSQARSSDPTAARHNTVDTMQRPMGMMGFGGMGSYGMGICSMYQPYQAMQDQARQAHQVDNGKGKGRMVELDDKDWETEFAQLETDHQAAMASLQQQQEDQDAKANLDIERELEELDRSVLPETDHLGDFETVWKNILSKSKAAAEQANHEGRNLFGQQSEEPGADFTDWADFDSSTLNTHLRDPQFGAYLFEEENLFQKVDNPFEEGVKIMDEAGNLSLAALAFEAAVHKDPSHIEAWTRLGAAQAQNEKETPAIRALEQAIKLDPNNLEALMGLAVSYTNEGYDSTAYRTLERWLSIKYPAIVGPLPQPKNDSPINEIGFTDRALLHERVTDLFIKAAQLSPEPDAMDPDVQVGLGVLFYGGEEFSKAVDCFSAALASSERGTTTSDRANQRPLLWNRLGATLANSGRSEEAIEAYGQALSLNPSFVRARYNLGVSCINIGCYNEAAQHLLGALAMHKVVEKEGKEKARELLSGGVTDAELDHIIRQNQSTNLYDTLRRVFGQMGRKDLADKVTNGVDVDIFRGEFDF